MAKHIKFLTAAITAAIILLAACGGSGGQGSQPAGLVVSSAKRGDEIMAELLKRDAVPLRKSRVRFTITGGGQPEKVYEIDSWRKQAEDETVTLTRIVKPAEDSDLASLTVEAKGKPTVVTSYVASRGEFRETGTNKMFFGGLTAGELLGEWDKFDFEFKGERTEGSENVIELEGKLKEASASIADKMTVQLDPESYIPKELRLFDNTGRQIRTYTVREMKTDAKGSYAARTEVENPVYKNRIVIEVLEREFPENIDAAFFTRDNLKMIAAGGS